jgi:hypothetical protein
MSAYNYPLMRKVLEQIEAHPETHNQDHFYRFDGYGYGSEVSALMQGGGDIHACGTTACIAGWAHWFSAPPGTPFDTVAAAEALGIPFEESLNIFLDFDSVASIAKLRALIATEGQQS